MILRTTSPWHQITPTRSVDCVGPYHPLDTGFDYQALGVVPKPVSAYR